MPKVSICLPVYNGRRFLGEAIETALAQTFSDFEFLIADDRSTDDSFEIAESYARQDKRIVVWRNEENKGLFNNYNETMSRATGDFIKPFAQDDLWAPSIVQRCLDTFGANPDLSLVAVGRQWITADGAEISTQCEFDTTTTLPADEVVSSCLLRLVNWIGEPSTVMFPRQRWGSGFDADFYHMGDLEYWFRVLDGGTYTYLHEPLCLFRRHDGSTTNRNLKGLLFALDMMLLGDKFENVIKDNGLTLHEFKIRAASTVSDFWGYLHADGEISLGELLDQRPKTVELCERQLRQFKELSFYALLAATEQQQESRVRIDGLREKLYRTEENLASVLTSRFWQSTSLLRTAACKLRGVKRVK